jgi:hypothetical protein
MSIIQPLYSGHLWMTQTDGKRVCAFLAYDAAFVRGAQFSPSVFHLFNYDELVKSRKTAFCSWFDTSPRTENHIVAAHPVRSP